MFQRKGEQPCLQFPNFKMLLPISEKARTIIIELLEDVGLTYTPVLEGAIYIIHRKGEIGEGATLKSFIEAPYSEMTLTELIDWKIVPLSVTLAEVEKMVGHKLKIIGEKNE